jgi:hypothetical protein
MRGIRLFCAALVVCVAALVVARAARAEGTLTVGMTAGDLPATTGNPDQGFEGYRFVGYNLYDSLVLWDLSQGDKASDIKPGLANELAYRRRRQQALDLRAAQRRQMARRLRFQRRRRAVEHEILGRREGA